jgi:hypothetical protein
MKEKSRPLGDVSCQTMKFVLILDVVQVNAIRFTVFFHPNYVLINLHVMTIHFSRQFSQLPLLWQHNGVLDVFLFLIMKGLIYVNEDFKFCF